MIIVGIAGPSGAGKSTLCQYLAIRLPSCRILQQDWYFRDPDELNEYANFCDLQYLHLSQFIADVYALKSGNAITLQRMDMATFRRTNETICIEPGEFLLLEGMTLFRIPEICAACDYRLYLSPGMAAIRCRKWRRDRHERGKPPYVIRRQLAWVECEYRDDLRSMPPEVLVILDALPLKHVGNLALKFILGAAYRSHPTFTASCPSPDHNLQNVLHPQA